VLMKLNQLQDQKKVASLSSQWHQAMPLVQVVLHEIF